MHYGFDKYRAGRQSGCQRTAAVLSDSREPEADTENSVFAELLQKEKADRHKANQQ